MIISLLFIVNVSALTNVPNGDCEKQISGIPIKTADQPWWYHSYWYVGPNEFTYAKFQNIEKHTGNSAWEIHIKSNASSTYVSRPMITGVNTSGWVNVTLWVKCNDVDADLKLGVANDKNLTGSTESVSLWTSGNAPLVWTKYESTYWAGKADTKYLYLVPSCRGGSTYYGDYYVWIDDIKANNEDFTGGDNYNDIEMSIMDSKTNTFVEGAVSGIYDYNTTLWNNQTVATGQYLANVTANHTFQWVVTKDGYSPYIETFTSNYLGDDMHNAGVHVIKSCSLVNMGEPGNLSNAYVIFRVTGIGDRLSGANIELSDGQAGLTDWNGIKYFEVTKNTLYQYQVRGIGYYSNISEFNISTTTYIDVVLSYRPTPTPVPGVNPTPNPMGISDNYGAIEELVQDYKNIVNSSINVTMGSIFVTLNNTVTHPILQMNDSINMFKERVNTSFYETGIYGNVYIYVFKQVFTFMPLEVEALIIYFFAWLLVLILLGK